MRKYLKILSYVLIIVIVSGCTSKNTLIKMRTQTKSVSDIKENIDEINKILPKKSTDPEFYYEAMKTGMILSSQAQLSSKYIKGYKKLMNNYFYINKNGSFKDSLLNKSFLKKPLFGKTLFGTVVDTKKHNIFVKDYAIYCLVNAGGSDNPSASIKILYTLNQYDRAQTILLV